MFGAFSEKHFIIGTKQVRNAIESGKVKNVYIASDSENTVISPVIELAKKFNLPVFYVNTRKELGEICRINVKTACAAETI